MSDVRVNGGAVGRIALGHDFGDSPVGGVGRIGGRSVQAGPAPDPRAATPGFGDRVARFFEGVINLLSPPAIRAEREHRQALRDASAVLGTTLGALASGDRGGAEVAFSHLRGAAEGALRGGPTFGELLATRLDVHLSRLDPAALGALARTIEGGPPLPPGDFALLGAQVSRVARERLLSEATSPLAALLDSVADAPGALGPDRLEGQIGDLARQGRDSLGASGLFGAPAGLSDALLGDALAQMPPERRLAVLPQLSPARLGALLHPARESPAGLDTAALRLDVARVVEEGRAHLVESVSIKADALVRDGARLAGAPAELARILAALSTDLDRHAALCAACRLDASPVDGILAPAVGALAEMGRLDATGLRALPLEGLARLHGAFARFDIANGGLDAETAYRQASARSAAHAAASVAVGALVAGGPAADVTRTTLELTDALDASVLSTKALGGRLDFGPELEAFRSTLVHDALVRAFPEGTEGLQALRARLTDADLHPLGLAIFFAADAVGDDDGRLRRMAGDLDLLGFEVEALLRERGLAPEPVPQPADPLRALTQAGRSAMVSVGLTVDESGRPGRPEILGDLRGDAALSEGLARHVEGSRADAGNDVRAPGRDITHQFSVDVARTGKFPGRYMVRGADGIAADLVSERARLGGSNEEIVDDAETRLRDLFGADMAFRVSQAMNQSTHGYASMLFMAPEGSVLRDALGRPINAYRLVDEATGPTITVSRDPDGSARLQLTQSRRADAMLRDFVPFPTDPGSVIRTTSEVVLRPDGAVVGGPVTVTYAIQPAVGDDLL